MVAAFSTILDILIEAPPRLPHRAPFLFPVIGALIAGILVLKRVLGAGGEGIPSYIAAVNKKWGHLNTAATVLKFPATLITLGFYGSGALIYSFFGHSVADPAYYGFMACGMAAMLSSVMNIPIAAMLITLRLFGHNYIIPIVIGSILSFLLYKGRYLCELTTVPPNDLGGSER